MVPLVALRDPELVVLSTLFLFEASIVASAKALHMKGERSIEVFLASGPGIALLFSAALILLAGTVLLKQYVEQRRQPSRYFRLMLMMNLVTVMLVIVASEIAL